MKRILLLVFVLVFALAAGAAEDKFGDVTIKVVKVENGKPIRNATVVLHALDEKGKEQGSINLKTDSEGKTSFNNLPYGKLRVQVIARGRRTFGQDYDVNQADNMINIKLEEPAEQYSIYEQHPQEKPSQAPEKKK